jgi:8-oxo-dGTP diphosphatase
VKVVVAIIFDNKGRLLITQRSMHTSHGGLWEFPGGKLEAGELPAEALIREIKEEVGLDILEFYFIGEVVHHYDTKIVNLLVFGVSKYRGKALCCESQIDLRWVSVDTLSNYDFPEANIRLFEMIKEFSLE